MNKVVRVSKAPSYMEKSDFLVRFGSVWLWLVTVLSIVWPRGPLLCPFHKKLSIWWKRSFGFCRTDNPRFSCIMYCYKYRQLTHKNLEVSEFSTKRKPLYGESPVDVYKRVEKLQVFHVFKTILIVSQRRDAVLTWLIFHLFGNLSDNN